MIKISINQKYKSEELADFINNLPEAFSKGGKTLYSGRNIVKSFEINGMEMIVKKFHTLSFFRALLYIGRESKATRAYKYAFEILKRGFITPEPVAVINHYAGPLLHDSYFISLPMYAPDMTPLRVPDFDESEAKKLAQYVFYLQQHGILHGDLNLTNILLTNPDEEDVAKRFAIIDTNRSHILFQPFELSIDKRASNFKRLTHRRDLLRFILISLPLETSEKQQLLLKTMKDLLQMEKKKRIIHKIFPH